MKRATDKTFRVFLNPSSLAAERVEPGAERQEENERLIAAIAVGGDKTEARLEPNNLRPIGHVIWRIVSGLRRKGGDALDPRGNGESVALRRAGGHAPKLNISGTVLRDAADDPAVSRALSVGNTRKRDDVG